MMTVKPKFTHDCERCVFLGHVKSRLEPEDESQEAIDIYWCKSPRIQSLDSVIGRYSCDGPDYYSSHPPEAFAGPEEYLARAGRWYLFALVQAARKGLYNFPAVKRK